MKEILFVHDQQASPAPRRAALERAGWRVRATHSAHEALAWIRADRPAVVLLDVLVEGGPGFEACRRIRELAGPHELPVILGCHLYHDEVHAAEAARAGAQRWLVLPIAPEELVAAVTAVLAARDAQAA
jgi:DNA-binding response OmpR family regulator